MALRKAGLSFTDSPRALMSSEKSCGSLTQAGISPQRTSANCRCRRRAARSAPAGSAPRCSAAENSAAPVAEQAPDRFRRRGDQIASAHARPLGCSGCTHHTAQIWRQTTSPTDNARADPAFGALSRRVGRTILSRASVPGGERRHRARRQDPRGAPRPRARARRLHPAGRRGRGRRDARGGGRPRGARGNRPDDRAGRTRRVPRRPSSATPRTGWNGIS